MIYTAYYYNEGTLLYILAKMGDNTPLYSVLSHYKQAKYIRHNQARYMDTARAILTDCNKINGYCNRNFLIFY